MFALVSLLACSGAEETPETPTLAFLAPEAGATVPAGDVAVSLVVEHVTLTAPTATARFDPTAWLPVQSAWAHGDEGEESGFVRLSLDGAAVADLTTTQYTLSGVAAGAHVLDAAIVYSDGHEPGITATVSFTAE